MDDKRKYNTGKQGPGALQSPPRKQKSEPGTGVRKQRGRNKENKTKMIRSKNSAPTSLG